nr:uncharacterized protein LOC123759023 [Procambarus clarkii]
MSSGDEEEIAEEIPEYNEDDASLTDSKGESFIFPVVGLQADETSIAGILLNQNERTTVDEHACIQIAETLSLSPEAKSLLNEPLHFTSNGDDPKIISPETLTKKNENGQKEKEVEGEAMAPKSYKSLSQHDDTLLKHQTTKSCSKRDHTNSPDELSVSSDWSVESFSSHSTGNYSEYIKDRSVSEVAVSVPKLTVISLDSACKVSSLVKQFSLQNEDLNDKTTDTGPRRQSLPVDLSQATYLEANSFMSLLHDKQSSLRFDESSCSYTSKECVSSKIGYFNRQDKEEHLCDKGPRESPKKLGHLSPRVKASLEKIGTCLSRGSSIDSHIDLEERQILKSKENLTFKEASKNIPKILLASQKENTPCHKTKLKKMLQKINKEKLVSLGKMEELGDVNVSLSECSTCISSLVNSKHTMPSENKCTAQESSHPEITKVAAEDVCDTEEEVEDMPVEMEQNIARYSKVENEDICVNENQFSLVNSSQSSNEPCSLEPSKSSRISRVSDGEAGVDSFHNNFSEGTKKKISCILDINTDEDREVVCKKSFKFFSDENLCQSTDSNIQAAASSQLDTSDGRLSNTAAKAGDGPKVDTNCGAQSNKLKERNISEASECPSQDDFPMSLENESCDELINLEIDHSGDEVFGDDFSDASEFVIELVSKSPISAITERTEESGQENENLNSRLERVSDLCSENSNESLKQTVDNSNPGNTCQSIEQKMVNESAIIPTSEKHFPSLPLSVVNDSSHFTGTSSVLEDSLVQTQTSLLARNESVDPHSSQCFASVVGQYSSKPGTKAKLPILNNNLKEDKIEKSATPPSSPTIKTLYGPVRTTLHRNSSRSMHNLASSHGSAYKSQGLHNRALSLSNDNLESNSLRAKSLSPGPVPRQKLKCSPESERRGNLNRRCISAVALNENEGQVNLKRNRSFSLNKLNRSRSSSLTSISSSKKLDYSQVPSKVRQYIKEMKDKDIRNSTRSLPSTPARKKKQQATSQIVVLDEKLLRELSQYDDDDEMPDDIRKIRDQIIGEKGDSKRLEDILKLLILERKSRHASDTTLAALQLRFDNLNALFAEKQNEIDRLRFYKDIQVNKEYIFSIQTQEERIITSDRSSHNTTAPNTPNKSAHHYLISPNMTRRSSYQTTPPNTPNIRSLSPTLSHYNIIKTTSTPIADPNWSFAYDPNSSYMFQEKHAGGVSRVQCSTVSGEDRSRDIKNQERNRNPENQEKSRDLKDQAMSKDLKTTESSHDAVSLELWMKDARTVLKRIREFALLEGSAALQHSEKSIIWNSILQQYWHLSYRFPVLTLLASSNEPGILLQELGQAIQATAHRFDLEIVAGRYEEGGRLGQSEPNRTSCVDTGKGKESCVKSVLDEDKKFSVDGGGKYGSPKIVSKVIEQVCCELNNVVQNTQNDDKNTSDPSCRVDDLIEEGSHNAVQYSPKELEKRQHGLEKDDTKLQERNENQMSKNEKRVDIREASALSANIPMEAYQHNFNQVEVKSTPHVLELGTAILGGLSSGVPVAEKVEMGTLAVCSPAHSRESLKTVGPLEKVKLWQASLVDPEVPHAAYESSNISPAPSILSLNSSQSFDPHVDPSNSLTKIHVDSTQSPNKSGTNLLLDHATKGNSRSVRSKIINYSPQDHSIDCNSPLLRSPDRLDFDLPKCSWRSSSATPRLPWGRTIKVRDLDSGCPGSEQSTRMSHNASLEQPEQLEMPHFHSSLDATSNVKVSSTILVEPNQFREHDNEEREEDYAYECENANKVVSRSSSHSHDHDNTSRGTAEASPPSDVVKMAFPESEKCEIENVSCTDIDRKSRALSASRSSINSSKKRIDQHYSHSESQDAIQKHRHGRPISADLVGTNGSNYYRREKSRNSDSKENTLHEGDVRSRDRDFISDVPYAHQRMKPRKLMEKKMLVGKERSKSFQNDLKISAFAGKEQSNKSNLMSTMDKDIFKQSNTKKYSTKYVSGNSSDYSDTSSCSQNSSNIYNNITKLKRDLNIIKSQMMNLTSEVFQKKRSKGEGVHSGSNNQSSRLQKRRKPIKALDMSVYSEESERDSSITSLDPYVHQTLEDQKPWSSKHRATTPAKIKSRNGTKEEFHKQPRSPPLDWNVKDSWQDKSTSFPNSSLEMLSESMFTAAKIEKLPRSTPKNKKCHSDRSRKLSPCPVNSRAVNETEDKKCGECVKRNLFLEDNVKATNVQEYLTDQNQSSKRLPSVHNSTKHVSIQTEKSNNKIIHIPELAETAALTTGTSNEVSTDGTHIKHQGKQPTQTTDGQFLNTTAPVIYIQNYNCRNETSQAGSDAVENLKSPQRSSDRCKHRRSGSAQELLVSLDEATTLAERLRSRTESMLSYLNLHFTVHVDQIQS